jgi:hypothetical protein
MASGGVTSIPDFVKICPFVQNTEHGDMMNLRLSLTKLRRAKTVIIATGDVVL